MGLRSFISNNIVDLGPPSQPAVAQVSPVAPPPTPAGQAPATTVEVRPWPTTPAVDAGMVADIQKIVSRRPTAFSALDEKITTLKAAGLDESSATRAAWALLKAEGKNAAQVISAIDVHFMDIDTEQRNFITSSQQASGAKVARLRSEVDQLHTSNDGDSVSIENLRVQIQQIQDRINTRSVDAAQKAAEANAAESEINFTVSKFTTACDSVKAALSTKKVALQSMLT